MPDCLEFPIKVQNIRRPINVTVQETNYYLSRRLLHRHNSLSVVKQFSVLKIQSQRGIYNRNSIVAGEQVIRGITSIQQLMGSRHKY